MPSSKPESYSRAAQVLDLAMLADGVPSDDLMYVRRVLERESASLAAGRIDDSAKARLRVLASLMRAPLPADEIADADHEFHMLLLQWSGNAALQLLGASLSQALHRSMRAMREYLAADRRAQLDMARAYDRILNAVIAGDHDLAWREMGPPLHPEPADRPAHRTQGVSRCHYRGPMTISGSRAGH